MAGPAKPPLCDKLVEHCVGPVPGPREPAPKLKLRRDHGGPHARDNQIGKRPHRIAALAPMCLIDVVPADQFPGLRVPVRGRHVDPAGDDRAAPLEWRAQRVQLLSLHAQLSHHIIDEGWTRGREVVKEVVVPGKLVNLVVR